MGRVTIIPQEDLTAPGLNIDVTITENHNLTSKVTSHRVEKGANIADNIREDPATLTLDCKITDDRFQLRLLLPTLNTNILNNQGQAFNPLVPFSNQVYDYLRELQKNKTLLLVDTSLRLYENMVIESVTIPRKMQSGINFTMVLKEIMFVYSSETEAEKPKVEKEDAAKKKKDTGRQKQTEADAETVKKKSVLKSLLGG